MDDREHSGRTALEGAWERGEIEKFLASAPIFYQPWWLEAISPGNWDYAAVRRGSEIAAIIPFVKRTYGLGQVALGMPEMTLTLGPWLRFAERGSSEQMAEQTELMMQLIDALPPHSYFRQNFHYSITNWLPFYWKGFTQTTAYTYVWQDLSDLDAIWRCFDHDVRTNVHKAQRLVRVVDDLDIDTFNEVRTKSFARQRRKSAWSLEFISRMDEACKAHNARKIFFAVDSKNQIHCTVYMVWTEYAAYLIMGGGDPALRSSGANYLLIWEAIQFARTVARTLDLEMAAPTEPIEHSFRLFGARLVPYYRVTRDQTGSVSKIWSVFRHLVERGLSWGDNRRFRGDDGGLLRYRPDGS